MTNRKFGLMTIGAGIAAAAAGWLGYGAGGLMTTTTDTATGTAPTRRHRPSRRPH